MEGYGMVTMRHSVEPAKRLFYREFLEGKACVTRAWMGRGQLTQNQVGSARVGSNPTLGTILKVNDFKRAPGFGQGALLNGMTCFPYQTGFSPQGYGLITGKSGAFL